MRGKGKGKEGKRRVVVFRAYKPLTEGLMEGEPPPAPQSSCFPSGIWVLFLRCLSIWVSYVPGAGNDFSRRAVEVGGGSHPPQQGCLQQDRDVQP